MKKIGIVLGAAAVVSLAGCKDPEYNYTRSTDTVRHAAPVEVVAIEPVETAPVTLLEEPKCQCAPGTTHATACACGASNCECKVESPNPVEPEFTIYIVQRGDILASISKKFNIKQSAILAINPQITDPSKIKLGQKIKLPGKVDVGVQTVPAGAIAPGKKATDTKAEYKPYVGPTKEYVVKAGDYLGSIAASSGISVRQLKELNSLTKEMITVGQKLKVPASKVEKSAPASTPAETKAASEPEAPAPADADTVGNSSYVDSIIDAEPVAPVQEDDGLVDYVVVDGDSVTSLAIQNGIAPSKLRAMNGLAEGEEVVPGQKIKIPEML